MALFLIPTRPHPFSHIDGLLNRLLTRSNAVDIEDSLDTAQNVEDIAHLLSVRNLEAKTHYGNAVIGGMGGRRQD